MVRKSPASLFHPYIGVKVTSSLSEWLMVAWGDILSQYIFQTERKRERERERRSMPLFSAFFLSTSGSILVRWKNLEIGLVFIRTYCLGLMKWIGRKTPIIFHWVEEKTAVSYKRNRCIRGVYVIGGDNSGGGHKGQKMFL